MCEQKNAALAGTNGGAANGTMQPHCSTSAPPAQALYLHGVVAYSTVSPRGELGYDDGTGCAVLPVETLEIEHYEPSLVRFAIRVNGVVARRIFSGDFSITLAGVT